MVIRRLGAADGDAYRTLRLEALKLNPEAFASSFEEEELQSVEAFEKRLSAETVFTFGAFQDNVLVGVVTAVPESKRKLQHRANIFAMYVTSASRGGGIGRNLMGVALDQVRGLDGIEQVLLSVSANNDSAKGLYRSLGFESYGVEKKSLKMEDGYVDTELMVLFL